MRFLAGFVAALALVVSGCGSDTPERASANTDATALLRSTVTNVQNLKSAAVDLKLSGSGEAVSATGAFERTGEKELPKFTLHGTAKGKAVGATWTGEEGFVTLDGATYEVPAMLVGQVETVVPTTLPDVTKWVSSPTNAGFAEGGGVQTVKITGTANVAQIRSDLQALASLAGAQGKLPSAAGTDAKIEVYTGAADSQLRRLVVSAQGSVVDLTLTRVGEDQAIEAPKDAKPFSELQGKLGGLMSGLAIR